MNERIKMIRKNRKMTQTEFGAKIGLKGNTITNYESGIRTPSDAVILSICREFGVNEHWLRTGDGTMFIQTNNSIIDQLANEFNLDDLDKKILDTYIQLPNQYRTALKKYLISLSETLLESKLNIEKEVAAYRRELEDEQKGKILSASAASGEN